MSELRYRAVAATHIGQREDNEDSYLVDRQHNLVVIADGVGGHHAGEIASQITCATLEAEVAAGHALCPAVELANKQVRRERKRSGHDMGATVVALSMDDSGFEVAWAGDSRAYLWDGHLKQLTRDHSLVEAMHQRGELTREEARNHPRRNVITQAVGLQPESDLEVLSNAGSLAAGQVFLLCSDGVTDVLDDQAIVLILQLSQSLEARCMQLVSTAVGLGGQDNTTAVLVEVLAAPREAAPREPDIFWDHDPATDGLGARTLRPIELVEVELNSGRLPPEITQVISIEEVERELKARTPKGGFLSRLLRR